MHCIMSLHMCTWQPLMRKLQRAHTHAAPMIHIWVVASIHVQRVRMYAFTQQSVSLAFSTTPPRRWTSAHSPTLIWLRCLTSKERGASKPSRLPYKPYNATVVPTVCSNRGCIADLGPRGPHPSLQFYPTTFPARVSENHQAFASDVFRIP